MKSRTPFGKISLVLPRELLERLDETAKREGRSRSAQVRYTLGKSLPRAEAAEEKG